MDMDTTIRSAEGELRQQARRQIYDSLYAGPALEEFRDQDTYAGYRLSREILEVKQETETRAVVLVRIRNVAPVPENAVWTDYDRQARRDGDLYRYILERASNGWRVSQIKAKRSYDDTWSDQYRPERVSVPTFTIP